MILNRFRSFAINSLPIKLSFSFLFIFVLAGLNLHGQQTHFKYLSGVDKDHTVTWDFFCTKGNNSGKWTTIQVPSNWELQGFGSYDYGKTIVKADEEGFYKYNFKADAKWKGKIVNIVFEGSMTDTEVKINGKLAGKIHQGSFYQFKYNISELLKYDSTNLLEVKVSKQSANKSINSAEREVDFWVFGGIFRPVYLQILPQTSIEHLAIDAKADGSFLMNVYTKNQSGHFKINANIINSSGQKIKAFTKEISTKDTLTVLKGLLSGVKLWSSEFPNLYSIEVNLLNSKNVVVHSLKQKFGFRTVELRPKDGIYLNGGKVIFKGVNRHSFWPSSGRTMSKELSINDVNMIKDMNMNAVRMSHYPPDQHFLDVCDSLGLMVLDELGGWQKNYDDSTGHRLIKQMVKRDVNHPSIVIWDNGNEGGFNFNLDDDFAKYDPQKRTVIHPWARFRDTDTKHYPTYNYLQSTFLYDEAIYFPTEFLHGLYDGGHGAGLDDYWNIMLKYPNGAGGFLWVFADEAVVRTDKGNILDGAGNMAPDGIVGPYHEKEGSYFTIKEIWSPVYIDQKRITAGFNGLLPIENRYIFTNLNQCKFTWKLSSFISQSDTLSKKVDAGGVAKVVTLKPGEKGWLNLALPINWKNSDVLYLTATDPHSKEIFTWSWPIKTAKSLSGKWNRVKGNQNAVVAEEIGDLLKVSMSNIDVFFDKTTGYIKKVVKGERELSLSSGPVLAGLDQTLATFGFKKSGNDYIVNAEYKGKDNWLKLNWTFTPGLPLKLEYSYYQKADADYAGITFNYPEEKITGMKYLGRGPFHVWKNRLKGQRFDFWSKTYNQTITGESYQGYPEFRGNHAEVYWAQIQTKEFPFKIFMESDHMFLQMLQTGSPKGAGNKNTTVNYPKGNIGLMDYIQPIGTKFTKTEDMGPQSQTNVILNKSMEKNVIWFDFN